jgi:cytochrome c
LAVIAKSYNVVAGNEFGFVREVWANPGGGRMLRIWNQRLGTFLMAALLTSPALAQSGLTDPSKGKELADSLCSICHNVGPAPGISAASEVPSFYSIANRPEQSPDRLAGAIIFPHPEMPKVSFSNRELKDIIAYIMSLKAKD